MDLSDLLCLLLISAKGLDVINIPSIPAGSKWEIWQAAKDQPASNAIPDEQFNMIWMMFKTYIFINELTKKNLQKKQKKIK